MRLGGLPKRSADSEKNCLAAFFFMHLLYLDDSGSVQNANEAYLVLAGVSIYETQGYYLNNQLDELAQSIDAHHHRDIEFHASEIYARRKHPWDKMDRDEAKGVIKAVLKIAANSSNTTSLFGCAIHKKSHNDVDQLSLAFEDLCQRFDYYMKKYNSEGERQKGLLILDKSSYETTLQKLAQNFREIGTQWGSIRHIADTPFFVDSKASRIIQLADHVAYAIYRRYSEGDTQYFDIIANKFHSSDNVIHGLAHKQKIDKSCMCPACYSRRLDKERNTITPEDRP